MHTSRQIGSRIVASIGACLLVVWLPAVADAGVQPPPAPPFYENFEPLGTGHWDYKIDWHTYDVPFDSNCWPTPTEMYCPIDPGLDVPDRPSSDGWGPIKFETYPDLANGGTVFSGERSGRQPIFDPYWVSIYHDFDPSQGAGDLRLKAMWYDPADILCDCDEGAQPFGYECDCENLPTPSMSRDNFRVTSWVFFSTPDRSEYFIFGVNTEENWDHYMWATKTDGWVVTNVPRTKAWHRVDIIVHPYTSAAGDVEFVLNGEVVGLGQRAAGGGNGVNVPWIRLGGDPAVMPQTHLANTFEQFWFDEVALTYCEGDPRVDSDADGDVDGEDFAAFQRCISGPGDPFTFNEGFDGENCQCMDTDGDKDVDSDDVDVFMNCVSGPGVPALKACDE